MTTLISLRNGQPADFEKITSVMPLWWNGRDLTAAILKVFFHHFNDTIFIAEQNNTMVGFLIGFLSQSDPDVGYIHFAGVHSDFRKIGVARQLYHQFYQVCAASNRSIVKSCTSPINKLSIAFHTRMGFTIEPGDDEVDGIPVTMNFNKANDPKVLFKKTLQKTSRAVSLFNGGK